jgi:hypothetical protein
MTRAILTLFLLGLALNTASYAEDYPYSSNSLDWSSSRSDSPYYDDHRSGQNNSNDGYLGSDLPPSEYQPDERSRERSELREFQRERTVLMPPLDGGLYSGKHNPYCTNAQLCGQSSR